MTTLRRRRMLRERRRIKQGAEIWRWIPGFKGHYQVSSHGRVRSVCRAHKSSRGEGWHYREGRILKLNGYKDGSRYVGVTLCKHGVVTSFDVHRLVALTFIPNPLNKPEVNHKDLNKRNNLVSNLEWVTQEENRKHAAEHGRYSFSLRGKYYFT